MRLRAVKATAATLLYCDGLSGEWVFLTFSRILFEWPKNFPLGVPTILRPLTYISFINDVRRGYPSNTVL